MFRLFLSGVFAAALAVCAGAAPSVNFRDIENVRGGGWWKSRHQHLTLPVSVSTTSLPTPTTSSVPPAVPTQDLSAGELSYLEGQNVVRRQHGALDLKWSNDLAAAAQKWATGCEFSHSGGTLGPFGENLAAGTGNFTVPAALKLWADEASDYDPSNPAASHFTQMVWKSTTEVGCAVASCSGIFSSNFGKASYYVCEYSPAGNVVDHFPENVQA